MKEELTEKMHSEFFVDEETDANHRAQSAASVVSDGMSLEKAAKLFGVTIERIKKQPNYLPPSND